MTDANSLIIKEFLIESFENLSSIGEELTQYEKDMSDKEALNSIFRKVHTLKGSASFLGFKKIQEITHSSENILDLIREDKISLSSAMIDVLLESFDKCMELLRSVEENGTENDKDYSTIVSKLIDMLEKNLILSDVNERDSEIIGDIENADKVEAFPTNEQKTDHTVEKVVEKSTMEEQVKQANPAVVAKKETKKEAKKVSSVADSIVRVDVELIDTIMNVVGELVLNRNQIVQYANEDESSAFSRLSHQLDVITSELQTKIMMVRMQPVGRVLNKFERIVRDLSREQGKKIAFSISGSETELDKTLVDAIKDPLTHLVRNSVDHGVEKPEDRIACGKSEEGHIEIKAYHEGGQVTIEIVDDGKGIDPQVIIQSALKKDVVTEAEAESMSDKDILNLIFKPGFSTAEKVTNISGRGVGMDVVKSNIDQIGGNVDITSVLGEGTSFKLRIPLTLAIVPALVVKGGEDTFALPQNNLVELVRIEEGKVNLIEEIHGNEFYRLRGDLIPIFRLSNCLNLDSHNEDGVADDHKKKKKKSINIVVLNAENRLYGLIVDQVLDTEEIVVKPLSKKLKQLSLFAGATIMGNGLACLIIDSLGFFNTVETSGHRNTVVSREEKEPVVDLNRIEILLVELNDSRLYSIPLIMVNRLEEFLVKDIEWSGDMALVRYRDSPMPIINLETILNLEANSKILNQENGNLIIPCIVIKSASGFFAFAVKTIRDISFSDSEICTDTADRDGFLGTIFVKDKTVTMLDIDGVIDIFTKGAITKVENEQKGRVLLVEDSPFYRKIMSDFLIEMGFDLVIKNNGQEGLDYLRKDNNFNLIMTDIEMPVLNGIEMAKEIRNSNAEFSEIPIIAVSSRVDEDFIEKGKNAGFNDHLEKFDKENVIISINHILASAS